MNTKSILAFAAIAAAFALIASPLMTAANANAFSFSQFIGQFQSSSQSGQCIGASVGSCLNTNIQSNTNTGSNIFASSR